MHVSWSMYVRSGVSPVWKLYPWALTFVDGELPLLMSPWVSDYTHAFCVHKMAVATSKLTSSYGFHEEWSHTWNLKNILKVLWNFPILEVHILLRILYQNVPHFKPFRSSGLSEATVNYSDPSTTCSFLAVGGKLHGRQGQLPVFLLAGEHTLCHLFLTFWNGPVWSALLLIPLFWLKQEDTVETILWRNFGMLFSPLQGRLPKVERFGWPPQHLPK